MKRISFLVVLFLSLNGFAETDLTKPIFELNPKTFCVMNTDGSWTSPIASIKGETNDFYFAEKGQCVSRSLVDIWGVTHNQDEMLWDGVDYFFTNIDEPLKGATHFYDIQYVVKQFITVRWNMHWHHVVMDGTPKEPKKIMINFQRVSGTRYIPYWEGTIFLEEVAPGITAVAIRNQINATRTTPDDAEGAILDLIDAFANGAPNFTPITYP